jgi:hypothetical protein
LLLDYQLWKEIFKSAIKSCDVLVLCQELSYFCLCICSFCFNWAFTAILSAHGFFKWKYWIIVDLCFGWGLCSDFSFFFFNQGLSSDLEADFENCLVFSVHGCGYPFNQSIHSNFKLKLVLVWINEIIFFFHELM